MCKFNPKNEGRRIDPCMKGLIIGINKFIPKHLSIVASCCGHGKYPMTIVMKNMSILDANHEGEIVFELISDITLPRRNRFYKKDKQGYYYVPEVLNSQVSKR